eukprot:CAMPEP_0167804068 /NCGR_PEP_ID=MMETSP0111_2-20121227/20245_1 /TAXON_ID=91324 /ORGANISM="Lotharella globosa, Strain CCCM811" /LENGTH=149 /DNA_ID=CAMNT_0007700725 /DNA_START=364 /DNA_END=813 /DNA_ORIENTATION=-
MISAKFFDDQYFNNAYYAKVGGVPCKEMNSLEVEFLFLTNFSLFVTYDTYKQYHTELRNHAKHSSCACNPHRVPKLEGEKDVSAADEEKSKDVIMSPMKVPKLEGEKDVSAADEEKSKDVIMMQTESVPRPNENHSQQQGTAMMASTPY